MDDDEQLFVASFQSQPQRTQSSSSLSSSLPLPSSNDQPLPWQWWLRSSVIRQLLSNDTYSNDLKRYLARAMTRRNQITKQLGLGLKKNDNNNNNNVSRNDRNDTDSKRQPSTNHSAVANPLSSSASTVATATTAPVFTQLPPRLPPWIPPPVAIVVPAVVVPVAAGERESKSPIHDDNYYL
jgi:hypothetical protein